AETQRMQEMLVQHRALWSLGSREHPPEHRPRPRADRQYRSGRRRRKEFREDHPHQQLRRKKLRQEALPSTTDEPSACGMPLGEITYRTLLSCETSRGVGITAGRTFTTDCVGAATITVGTTTPGSAWRVLAPTATARALI